MKSLCDSCYAPGFCCRKFQLFVGSGPLIFMIADGIGAIYEWLHERKLPFLPLHIDQLYYDRKTDLSSASWFYSCPALSSTGRCNIYDHRPHLCQIFEPGDDSFLCVHTRFVTDAGDGSAPYGMIR